MDFVSLADVVDRYEGTITGGQLSWVAAQLEDAVSLIRGKLPKLDIWIASGQVPASEARRVVSEMVLRRVRNPAGVLRENAETSGYVRDATAASGRLVVLEEELAALTPSGNTQGAVGTAALAIPGWRVP